MTKITHGNIIIIHIDDVEPSMAIIPKIDFQQCKIRDIFKKIDKLHTQFPNCNFKHTSLTFEDENKYHLYSHRHRNMSLTNWFHHRHISKDANNNYIFYVEQTRMKKGKQTKKKQKSKPKKKNNKSQKEK